MVHKDDIEIEKKYIQIKAKALYYAIYSIMLERVSMDSQIRKGLLEFCVLAVLEKKDSYGYQIIKDISPYVDISESTLYPILRRMEEASNIISHTEEYNSRLRKYFHLLDKGQEYLNSFRHEKQQLIDILDFIDRGTSYEGSVFKKSES